jgi:hypothetical protein
VEVDPTEESARPVAQDKHAAVALAHHPLVMLEEGFHRED